MADSEHNVTININGNANVAVNALNKVRSGLSAVGRAVSMLSGALGKINWAIHGVQMLVQGFTWLKDKITETAREIRKMRWDFEMKTAADETARLVGWHEKLAKLMKDELDTLNKQRAVEEIERNGKKDYEDGRREADRARQIFEAKTPEEEQALKDRFAAEDEQRERDERKADRKRRTNQLDGEYWVYLSKAESLKKNNGDIDQQLKDEKFNLYRVKDHEEYAEPIRKRIEALEKRKAANAAEIEQFEKEAAFRREQIDALKNQKDYDGPTAGEWNRRTEARKRAEEKARDEAEKAEKKKADDKRDAEEFVRAYEEGQKREMERKADDAEQFADRVAAAEGVSQNRLTAMGLGSGVQSDGGVASNVMKLVDLLRQNVEATKNINVGDGDGVGVYGE